jgi:hypothetical protein
MKYFFLVWSFTSRMHHRRFFHGALILDNGKVLVTGGIYTEVFPLRAAELYDSSTGTWTNTTIVCMSHELCTQCRYYLMEKY